MGSCASFKECEACNFSEYNQTLDFRIIVSNADPPVMLDTVDFGQQLPDDSRSWWKFERLLESDKSWELREKETGDKIN